MPEGAKNLCVSEILVRRITSRQRAIASATMPVPGRVTPPPHGFSRSVADANNPGKNSVTRAPFLASTPRPLARLWSGLPTHRDVHLIHYCQPTGMIETKQHRRPFHFTVAVFQMRSGRESGWTFDHSGFSSESLSGNRRGRTPASGALVEIISARPPPASC